MMCMEKSDWEKCAEFHGHVCPGLAVGYRAAQIGLEELAGSRAKDEELVAIAETDACGVDAVMVVTGCTLGKGNLLYRDFGKHAFTFMSRGSGEGVRICANPGPGSRMSRCVRCVPRCSAAAPLKRSGAFLPRTSKR